MDVAPKQSRWAVYSVRTLAASVAEWLVRRRVLPDVNPRWVLGGIGALLLMVGCVVTAVTRPSEAPLGARSWSQWLTSTLETAPYTRLTFVNTGFNAVAVSPDENTVWAVGDNGLALRSNDRGRSWTWVRLAPRDPTAPAPVVKEAPGPAQPYTPNQSAQQAPVQQVSAPQVSSAVPRYTFPKGSASLPGNVGGQLQLSIKELYASRLVYVTPFRTSDEPNDLAAERARQVAGILEKFGLPQNRIQIQQPIVSATPGVDVSPTPTTFEQSPVQQAPSIQAQLAPPSPQIATKSQGDRTSSPNFLSACIHPGGEILTFSENGMDLWTDNLDRTATFGVIPELGAIESDPTIASGGCVRSEFLEQEATGPVQKVRVVLAGENLGPIDVADMRFGPFLRGEFLSINNANPGKGTWLVSASGDPVRGRTSTRLPEGNYTARGGFIGNGADSTWWVVTDDARILTASVAQSSEWVPTVSLTNLSGQRETRALNSIFFLNDDVRGWVVGDDGLIYRTTDAGVTWSPTDTLTDESNLKAVVFLEDGMTGWAAGEGGLYGSHDGGATWSPVALHEDYTRPWLGTEDMFRPTNTGTLERCASGSPRSCADVPTNILLPAPLALFTFAFAFLTLTLAGYAPDRIEPEDESAQREDAGSASAYASDRPLTQGDFDLLNLGGIARGLAEFLVNRRTEPPLSVAVDGPWGSGKSSLLNLFVGGEAAKRRFRIVWFNAWHHEREENTLGAILEMICRDAIPAFASPLGIAMRFRLLWSKIRERPLAYLAGVSAVVFVATIAITNPRILADLLEPALSVIAGVFGVQASAAGNNEEIQKLVQWGGGIFAVLYVLSNLQTKLFALAKSADGMLRGIIFTASRRALMSDVGLRNRFAREFAAVTKAMRPMRLIIVIDDLDRCKPAKVVEILQLVNYLMTSGECFVIAAADLNFVEACVRQEYEEVGGLLFSVDGKDKDKGAAERNLDEFAHRYLRKIINVVVRVPRMTAEQSKTFVNEDAINEVRDRRKSGRRSPLSYIGWGLAAVVAVVGPLLLAEKIAFDTALVQKQAEQAEQKQIEQQPTEQTQAANGPASGAPAPAVGGNVVQEAIPDVPLLVSTAQALRPASWWWYLLPLAILGYFASIAWQIWRIVEATRKTDSKAFTEALTRWVPLVYEQAPTPRDIRRFTNQARYLAAQNRYSGGAKLSDEHLVKFASLEFIDRDWFDGLDDAAVSQMDRAKTNDERKLPADWPASLKKAAHEAFASAALLSAVQRRGSIEDFRKVASRSQW